MGFRIFFQDSLLKPLILTNLTSFAIPASIKTLYLGVKDPDFIRVFKDVFGFRDVLSFFIFWALNLFKNPIPPDGWDWKSD